ncbi:MAG: hemolysin family protein [Firmicutes bacterium]|nr:hemolysin family protein [[Eubacterium] siraeum]MCM1488282.1 hemolysin family protein [Bacillota bacterium]
MDADGRKRKPAYYLLYPLILLEKGLDFLLKKALGDSFKPATEDEILSLMDAGAENGEIEASSVELINNVFEFGDMKISDVMTHRVNISAVEESATTDDIVYLALEEGFSRIPVYSESIDDIVGIILVKDLLCLIGKDDPEKYTAKDFIREVIYIPESCPCDEAFKQLTESKSGMAVAVDEYGGTAGLVTVEDLIESVMGNIQDEYDDEEINIKALGKGKYQVDGECDPEEVLELFGYELPEDHDYDTVAGFVTDLLGYIPENADKNPHADYEDVRFVVTEASDNRIGKMIVFKVKKEGNSG